MNDLEALIDFELSLKSKPISNKAEFEIEEAKQILKLAKKYRTLYEVGKLVTSEMDFDELVSLALDQIVELTVAERGFIALVDEHGQLDFKAARNFEKNDVENPQFQVSRSIINKVVTAGETICLGNALKSENYRDNESIKRLQLLSVLCAPIKTDAKVIGVIYVDNTNVKNIFTRSTGEFVTAFSDQVAIAIKNSFIFSALKKSNISLIDQLREKHDFSKIIGVDGAMAKILTRVAQIAHTDLSVIIEGENGTGKGLLAETIHHNSSRKENRFVGINCGALSENLVESELFGHIRGAFTGASTDKEGLFKTADKGTIFLDEIGDLPLNLQVKLLKVLDDGEFRRLGDSRAQKCNVRVIAATNQDLTKMVETKLFREDLYYRLKGIRLVMPPLRERQNDIPLLIKKFIGEKNVQLSKKAESMFLMYDYPGNVRELKNIVSYALAISNGEEISVDHLPEEFVETFDTNTGKNISAANFTQRKQRVIEQFERKELIRILSLTGGAVREAARMAGIDGKNFSEKIKKYGIKSAKFKE